MATDHNPALSPRLPARLPARPRVAQTRARSRSAAVAAILAVLSLLGLAACSSSTDQANPPTPTIESLTELPPPPPFDKEQADKDIKKVYEKYLQAQVDIQTKDYETQKTFLHPYVSDRIKPEYTPSPQDFNKSKKLRLSAPTVKYTQININKNEANYFICQDLSAVRLQDKATGQITPPTTQTIAYKINWIKDSTRGWLINNSIGGTELRRKDILREGCK